MARVEPFEVATLRDRPELLAEIRELGGSAWPDFLTHDATVNEWWPFLWDLAPDYQFALTDRSGAARPAATQFRSSGTTARPFPRGR